MKSCFRIIRIVLFAAAVLLRGNVSAAPAAPAKGPILLVHGHTDSAVMWTKLGPALVEASGGSRFWDSTQYSFGQSPTARFRTNGIYCLSYYRANREPGEFEPPISPVFAGATEIPPDDPALRPFLYGQSENLASRLAQIIQTAFVQSGQKVTLICHSMGGLVAEAAIAYFGSHDKVEKFVTLGTPLRGFPADFRVPTEILGNQFQSGFAYFRESLQMSEGVRYGGFSVTEHLESRYRLVRLAQPGLLAVNIVGTLSPFSESFMDGANDGVVRAQDARFRDPTLATVYEVPLAHMRRLAAAWLAPEDSLAVSPMTVQILEQEVLGLEPGPRVSTDLAMNHANGRVRVTVRNEGALPLAVTSASGRFVFYGNFARQLVDPLQPLLNRTIPPGQHVVIDGPAMQARESGEVSLALTVNGRTLSTVTNHLANIQSPEVEAALSYDVLNGLILRQWRRLEFEPSWSVPWDVHYRISGDARLNIASNCVSGRLTNEFYTVVTEPGGSNRVERLWRQEIPFCLDLTRNQFIETAVTYLGKTQMILDDAAHSPLRDLYRSILAPESGPVLGTFAREGRFSSLATLSLDRPVVRYSEARGGIEVDVHARFQFSYDHRGVSRTVEYPIVAKGSAVFRDTADGLMLTPRIESFNGRALTLSDSQIHIVNRLLATLEIPVAPVTGEDLDDGVRGLLAEAKPFDKLPDGFIDEHYVPVVDSFAAGVDVSAAGIRVIVDICEPRPGEDFSAVTPVVSVSTNGFTIRDRLVNIALNRNREFLHEAIEESQMARFEINKSRQVLGTTLVDIFQLLKPVRVGKWTELDRAWVKADYAELNIGLNEFWNERPFALRFDDARIRTEVPIDASLRWEWKERVLKREGVKILFFFGDEKKVTKTYPHKNFMAFDVDFSLYPLLGFDNTTNSLQAVEIVTREGQTVLHYAIPLGKIYVDHSLPATVALNKDDPIFGLVLAFLGEIVVEPTAKKLRKEIVSPGSAGGTFGNIFKLLSFRLFDGLTGLLAGSLLDEVAPRQKPSADLRGGRLLYQIPPETLAVSSNLLEVALRSVEGANAAAARRSEALMKANPFTKDSTWWRLYRKAVKKKTWPRRTSLTWSSPLPTLEGLQIRGLDLDQGAAAFRIEQQPTYGELAVTSIVGLDGNNREVSLTPDDLVLDGPAVGDGTLWFRALGLDREFSTLWVKRPVDRIRLTFAYEASFAARYNQPEHPQYRIERRQPHEANFQQIAGYRYDAARDRGTFVLEASLAEDQTNAHALRLTVPDTTPLPVNFVVGRDSSPLSLSGSVAYFDGSAGALTVGSTVLAYRPANGAAPQFAIDGITLLTVDDNREPLTLGALAPIVGRPLGPAETRVERLHGINYLWSGSLPPALLPEGFYHARIDVREMTLQRRGSVLLPMIVDRTPPDLAVWSTDEESEPVLSRVTAPRLTWSVADKFSAVFHDVVLEYEPSLGVIATGEVFTSDAEVLTPGQRDVRFSPDLSTVPDGIETYWPVRVRATDASRNRGVSTNLSVWVDTWPPAMLALFSYPRSEGPYQTVVNQSNHVLTVHLEAREAVQVEFALVTALRTSSWTLASSPHPVRSTHQAVWVHDFGEDPPIDGAREGSVPDGDYDLAVRLTDRGGNTTYLPAVRRILIDRTPPILTFASQQAFVPDGRLTAPLDLDTTGFVAGDSITEVALVNGNGLTAASTLASSTIRRWTLPVDVAALRAQGIPLESSLPGQPLPAGRYLTVVTAKDVAGNTTVIHTFFGSGLLPPYLEPLGPGPISGIVPINGIAVDPQPADRLAFRSRELFWAIGAGVPVPTDLTRIDPGVWRSAGLYVLPPRGAEFENALNKSGQMVSAGTLAYWNTTTAALALSGAAQATLPAAGLVQSPVTLLLVVRDEGGRAWGVTTSAEVDNRKTDLNALTAPGLAIQDTTVSNGVLRVNAALLQDSPLTLVVITDANGRVVRQETLEGKESANKLFGEPTYSTRQDFGFFVWFDAVSRQLKVRCVSPEIDALGTAQTRGHLFRFSVEGQIGPDAVIPYRLAAEEMPENVGPRPDGTVRLEFALNVPPGGEKGVAIPYVGGDLTFNALGLDDYVEATFAEGSAVVRRYWRLEEAPAEFPDALDVRTLSNLTGLDGDILRGAAPEARSFYAVANHGGALEHLFVGGARRRPLSPFGITLSDATVQADLAFAWDLRLPDGSVAEPGEYVMDVYTIDEGATRFHGARTTFTLGVTDVPFLGSGLGLSSTNVFNPVVDGAIVFQFLANRSSLATVQVLDASNRVVATLATGQALGGRTSTNAPHQAWWDGYLNGAPAAAGQYAIQVRLEADGVPHVLTSGRFTVAYPAETPRESDWGLQTQPIAFNPETRDRIVRDPRGGSYSITNDRAWITLRYQARLADGTLAEADQQVQLDRQGSNFDAVRTDPSNNVYLAVSPLFKDAVRFFERIQVRFNDRVVDVFQKFPLPPPGPGLVPVESRTGQFKFGVVDPGPEALRLQVILRARLAPWTNGLAFAFTEANQLFDSLQVREFVHELEFKARLDDPGTFESVPWSFRLNQPLVGYFARDNVLVPAYGHAVIDAVVDLEIRDRNGRQTLAKFNPWQIRDGGTSAIEQLFRLSQFTPESPGAARGFDLVLKTAKSALLSKSASLDVAVTPGYAGINAWVQIVNQSRIVDDLDPFPTRHYHAAGTNVDVGNGGRRFDDVKAYAGDSGLVQEITFSSNRIAGHVPFQYAIRPVTDGVRGQQTAQIHPWVPYSFRKDGFTNVWTADAGRDDALFGIGLDMGGDVNGDGFDDLVVGAMRFDVGSLRDAGQAYLFLGGGRDGLDVSPAWIAQGTQDGELFGDSTAIIGDVNRDGFDDVLVVSYRFDNGQVNEGKVFLYHGAPTGLSNSPAWTMEMNYDNAGVGIARGRCDFNGDGSADFPIGSPNYAANNVNNGRVFVLYGSATGPTSRQELTATNVPPRSLGPLGVSSTLTNFGVSVAAAGDINGDHYSDLIVGVTERFVYNIVLPGPPVTQQPRTNFISRSLFYFGSSTGIVNGPVWAGDAGSGFGVGDVNGDGFDDVAISDQTYTSTKVAGTNHGQVLLFLGSSGGLGSNAVWTVTGDRNQMRLGKQVVGADFDRDGYRDLAISADGYANPQTQTEEGGVFVYSGSSTGLATTPAWSAEGDQAQAAFGYRLAAGSDVNGDGYPDLAVGAFAYDGPEINEGRVFVYQFPRTAKSHSGWTRGGPGGGAPILGGPASARAGLTNVLPVPLVNYVAGTSNGLQTVLRWDALARQLRVDVNYGTGLSGFVTNAPFPLSPLEAEAWIQANMRTPAQMAQEEVPLDSSGSTNAGWQVNLRFAAVTNDLLVAASPDAYDAVVSRAVVDYTHFLTDDPDYHPTIDYRSEETAWSMVSRRLPTGPGLPAVVTVPAQRPLLRLTNVVLHPDPSFPPITSDALQLRFTQDPDFDGGENAYVRSLFDHEANAYFRPWTLADDPNIRTAAAPSVETVQVSVQFSNYVYETVGGGVDSQPYASPLLEIAALPLTSGITATQYSAVITAGTALFQRFVRAEGVVIRVTRSSGQVPGGETEVLRLHAVDLRSPLRAHPVRSARYRGAVTPQIIGAGSSSQLRFEVALTLDPPLEYSVRRPVRQGDRVALPLKVIDRQRFWQTDSGEYVASLFQEIGIEGDAQRGAGTTAGYLIATNRGFTVSQGLRPIATDSNYAAQAGALFWKTAQGGFMKNPRLLLGELSVSLKDPSGQEEAAAFRGRRYVAAEPDEYFHDLYVETNDVNALSWRAKIRPQAKEHAYVKIYGSVGGNWRLSYRQRDVGHGSGLLPVDAGSLAWTPIPNGAGTGRGQNQFLCYWDITELNGPYLLRLESSESPDNRSGQPEVKHLEVMLGQHLPGRDNPIFSPDGQPEMASLFSMHGRTQLTSPPEFRGDDDRFFTVNPIKLEERPFSMRPDGLIPLGERVQILPHTDYHPFSVSFYIDRAEYLLYDQFRLYHQLEDGGLAEIVSLPPSVRPKYTLIQGFVEHTSIVGFLPNPALRLVTLNVPRVSDDGVIRVAGSVDLFGTDDQGNKNEPLTVAIVVSPDENFYHGQVRARLATGARAEFPVPAQLTEAGLATGWTPAQPSRTFHVFAVVVNTNDDWLTLERSLSPADAGQHLFNVSRTAVTMGQVSGAVTVDGAPLFSPNADGFMDTIRIHLDFQREGLAQLEIRDGDGQTVHLTTVPLGADGRGVFDWGGRTTGLGLLAPAPDGFYTVRARYSDGSLQAPNAGADAVVEVRAASKYFGRLLAAGLNNDAGKWHTLWTHQGGTVYPDDIVHLEYSDTAEFGVVRGRRPIDWAELSALFDDAPTGTGTLPTDALGRQTLHYRVRVLDQAGNLGFSPVMAVVLPANGRMQVTSVSPAAGATNVSTEPVVTISLAAPSPFAAEQLAPLFQLQPAVPTTLGLSEDRRTIIVTPGAPFEPGTSVTAALSLFPAATGADVFRWTFRVLASNQVTRALGVRLVDAPSSLTGINAEATAFLLVTNRGNVPARLTLAVGMPSTNVMAVTATNGPLWAAPITEVTFPMRLAVTGPHRGPVSIPVNLLEQSVGVVTSLVMNVSVSSITSAPTLVMFAPVAQSTNPFVVRLSGQSQGDGSISTLARINGGSWWVVSQAEFWAFDAGFASDGDRLDLVARDGQGRLSPVSTHVFAAPPLRVSLPTDHTLSWEAQLGRSYVVEWSGDLQSWSELTGLPQPKAGTTIEVTPGEQSIQLEELAPGRVFVRFAPGHAAFAATNAYFRVRSDR